MLEIENQVGMLGRLLPGVEETLEDGIPLAASGRLLADADGSIAVLRQFNVGPGSAKSSRSRRAAFGCAFGLSLQRVQGRRLPKQSVYSINSI